MQAAYTQKKEIGRGLSSISEQTLFERGLP